MEIFEQLINQLDEGDRATAKALLDKYEPLRAGYLRQEDYSRNMDDLKKRESENNQKVAAWEDDWKRMNQWYEENQPKFDRMVNERDALQSEVTSLRQRVAEAAAGDPNVNVEELMSNVEGRLTGRYVTPEQARAIVDEEAKKLGENFRTEIFKQTFAAATNFSAGVAEARERHRDEFGKPLDYADFEKYMAEQNVYDPRKAYESYTAKARQEVEATRIREEAYKEAEQKVRQEMSAAGMPGSGTAPTLEKGAVQMMIDSARAKEGATPGSGSLAAQAAAELRSEGKF